MLALRSEQRHRQHSRAGAPTATDTNGCRDRVSFSPHQPRNGVGDDRSQRATTTAEREAADDPLPKILDRAALWSFAADENSSTCPVNIQWPSAIAP